MAHPALDAGIQWKRTVLQQDLDFLIGKLMADTLDPSKRYRIPMDISSINRIVEEISTLDGSDDKKKYDLVKKNLGPRLRSAESDLASFEGFVAERPRISEDMKAALATKRKAIVDLKKKLDDLVAEGRPQ